MCWLYVPHKHSGLVYVNPGMTDGLVLPHVLQQMLAAAGYNPDGQDQGALQRLFHQAALHQQQQQQQRVPGMPGLVRITGC